jgi:hypothetical protein
MGIRGVLNSAFQPIENLDPQVQDALRRYAGAVGPQSRGVDVAADEARHAFENGARFTRDGTEVTTAQEAADATRAQEYYNAHSDLNSQLDALGVRGDPQVQAVIQNIEQPSAIRANPLGRAVMGANSALKQSLFGLSNMHNYTEGLFATLNGPTAAANYGRAWLSPGFYQGQRFGPLAQDFNRAAMAGVTGLLRGIGGSDAEQVGQFATRAAIGGVGGAGAGYEESLRSGDTENAGRNAVVAGLAGAAGASVAAPRLFSGLFERAVPMAKVTIFKQLTAKGMPEQQAADAVNRTFGGLNYAQMGRSQTLQDAIRLLATAPDWNEATVRQLASAVAGKNAGQQYSRGLIAKAVAGPMIASEVLSYALNGTSTADNEPGHQLEVRVGTDKRGKGVYMGFMPGNVQAYGNLIDKIAGNPAATSADLGSFATGRLGMYPQAGIDLATGSEYIGGPKAKNMAASMASRVAPIGISGVAQGLERGAPVPAVASSLALGPNLRYGSAVAPQRRPLQWPTFGQPQAPLPAPSGPVRQRRPNP